ncbi:MAG: leucine-rich repeat domain-containing protein, partial [Lachnospiraceae bacterium]|nr:leucine-rich repeat domain-containing protein [Lachnospiraceae bacterium]
ILLAYKGNDAHVEIPDGVKQIGSEVFKGHTEILDAAVPASVEKICAEAFRNCSSLTGLTGCEGLKTVVHGAFYGTQISEDDFKK